VELYFFRGGYVGFNAVENGITNVCGLAREELLKAYGFEPVALLDRQQALGERLAPLTRTMDWLHTGPLVFSSRLAKEDNFYAAGDVLQFVDPFTGSGMFTALVTGMLAGRYAARGLSPASYREECRRRIAVPFRWSSLMRQAVSLRFAEWVLPAIPGELLFRLTRPSAR
jgi:flavin-dependent dehydrogenase